MAEVTGHKTMNFDDDDYIDDGGRGNKQTHVTFDNPDHPDIEVEDEEEEEKMREWYRAAKSVQSSRINRRAIVGDFLIAVDEDSIAEFLQEHSE